MSRVLFFGERLMAVTVDLSGNRLVKPPALAGGSARIRYRRI